MVQLPVSKDMNLAEMACPNMTILYKAKEGL